MFPRPSFLSLFKWKRQNRSSLACCWESAKNILCRKTRLSQLRSDDTGISLQECYINVSLEKSATHRNNHATETQILQLKAVDVRAVDRWRPIGTEKAAVQGCTLQYVASGSSFSVTSITLSAALLLYHVVRSYLDNVCFFFWPGIRRSFFSEGTWFDWGFAASCVIKTSWDQLWFHLVTDRTFMLD